MATPPRVTRYRRRRGLGIKRLVSIGVPDDTIGVFLAAGMIPSGTPTNDELGEAVSLVLAQHTAEMLASRTFNRSARAGLLDGVRHDG